MKELSLFERLEKKRASTYSMNVDHQSLIESVKSNLQQMLNVREGSVSSLPDYGMPDFNDLVHEFPDAIYQLQKAIKQFLLKYEPRIEDVVVSYIPDTSQPLQLKYQVDVRLASASMDASAFQFETVITGSGQAFVKTA
ncbi:type VI secretion system baseplate subunit TssE [Alkalimarinus sediminis]|uniref:Type VI secretion system baseplate subunit TssE n=1 Tax=Alkalimarinus sediminis TaxID=1632866 RepID=A0A9E8HHE8_9ALTE|nr:type VI secretion system baseplate subunit TssE [Alkalimarinus sediminis]UZW73407.1 type VI secretion system baseplate subunit TssE [Alkalimarinus sediminis]